MKNQHFDVVVVGGRCAGAPLAIQLARAGLRVCIIDKASFPSETLSTHGIQPAGVKVLRRLGLFEQLSVLAPPIDAGVVAFDDVHVEVGGLTERLGAPLLCVRRVTLDEIVLDAARQAGAEVRVETTVNGLILDGDRVAGVRTSSSEIRADLVVGADGVRSTVARLVGAKKYQVTPARRLFAWAYFEDTSAEHRVLLGTKGGKGYLACPADAGLLMAAVAPPPEHAGRFREDREAGYLEALSGWPEIAEMVSRGRRVGPIRVMWRWEGFFRHSAGPGWVLLGDAGHFKDPTPGQGIADALRQTETLAPTIEAALGGSGNPDALLRDWWAWRDRDAWEMYWFAYDMGISGPTPPLLKEIQQSIAKDPALIDGMMGVLNHDVLPSEVFTPALALRATARAVRRQRGQRRAVLGEMGWLMANQVRRRRRPIPT